VWDVVCSFQFSRSAYAHPNAELRPIEVHPNLVGVLRLVGVFGPSLFTWRLRAPATMDQTEINDTQEASESENANLDINEENTSGDNLNKIVGEQKFNAPLDEALPAPSVPNSQTGGNECTINKYPDPFIKYHFKFQKADDSFVAGSTCMYWKVELLSPMQDLQYNGNNITRLAGTILRPGMKFFCVLKDELLLQGILILYLGFSLMSRHHWRARCF
jgi:hypothetical protein